MSNTQHTPGPWAVDAEAYPIMIHSESETWPLVDELGNEEGCKGAFIANTGDHKANARLIAAAPDLLEALKELLSCPAGDYDTTDDYANACKKAEAAIAKATGGAV